MALSFAVVGLGRMGYRTVIAGRNAGLELVGICDSSPKPWGVEQDAGLGEFLVPSLDQLWARRPDIFAISTTADSHAALFQAALDAGVRKILVEKPVACSVADALAMAEAAKKVGADVLVNHNHRTWSVLKTIRAFDGDPRFGALKAFVITQGAGGFGNLGTHYFDLANWMFGATPTAIATFGTRPEAQNPRGAQFRDSGGVAVVSYPGGRRLVLEMGDDVGVIGGYEFRYEFGRVLMPFTNETPKVFVRRADSHALPKHFYGAALEELPFGEFAPTDVVENTRVVFQSLADGVAENGATLQEAATALEVTIGGHLSVERGEICSLPLSDADRQIQVAFA